MEGKIMGYARVSSKEQNLDRQIIALKQYVPEENIVVDKTSGKDLQRPGYQALKGTLGLRKGDTLVIKSLDRLSRNKAEMKQELKWFQDNGITLAASIACCTPLAAAQITMTQVAGYEFADYFKYCFPLTVICYIAIIVVVPFFFPILPFR